MIEKEEQKVKTARSLYRSWSICVGEGTDLQFHYLQQSLQRTPKRTVPAIQHIIDQIIGAVRQNVLGCVLCSTGIAGVTACRERVVRPRCHDHDSFFSDRPYDDNFLTIQPGKRVEQNLFF